MRQISNEEDSTHCIQHLTKWILLSPIASMIFFVCKFCVLWHFAEWRKFVVYSSCRIKFHATCSFLPFRCVFFSYHILYVQRNKIHCQAIDIQMIWLGNCASITWKQKQEETRRLRKSEWKGKWHQAKFDCMHEMQSSWKMTSI